MILIAGERSKVHVPGKAGAFDERDGSGEGGVHPMLAEVDATPDVVGVVAKAGGDAEVVIDRGDGSRVFRGGSRCAGHNRCGSQREESQRLEQCVQFHGRL